MSNYTADRQKMTNEWERPYTVEGLKKEVVSLTDQMKKTKDGFEKSILKDRLDCCEGFLYLAVHYAEDISKDHPIDKKFT